MRFTNPGQFTWHCHIVSHEDNEMVRPYRIGREQDGQPMPQSTRGFELGPTSASDHEGVPSWDEPNADRGTGDASCTNAGRAR